jgi:hypothetical protein
MKKELEVAIISWGLLGLKCKSPEIAMSDAPSGGNQIVFRSYVGTLWMRLSRGCSKDYAVPKLNSQNEISRGASPFLQSSNSGLAMRSRICAGAAASRARVPSGQHNVFLLPEGEGQDEIPPKEFAH